MAVYAVRIYKNNVTKTISLPAQLCRGCGLTVGDTIMLEPQIDGTIKLYPAKLLNPLVQTMGERAREHAN